MKPYPESVIVNLADVLQIITKGFLKSSIHRVVAPLPDQADVDRHEVLYFVRPRNDLKLNPVQTKVTERLGYGEAVDENVVGIKAGERVKARVENNVKEYPDAKNKERPLFRVVSRRSTVTEHVKAHH